MAKLFPDPPISEENPPKPMNVGDLIAYLQALDPAMPVAYQQFSENCELWEQDLEVKELGLVRPDGWIPNKRPDMPTQTYLLFPGN